LNSSFITTLGTFRKTLDKLVIQLSPTSCVFVFGGYVSHYPESAEVSNVSTKDAVAWLDSIACRKPKDLGLSYELWTTS
jgi:hypothetical protein